MPGVGSDRSCRRERRLTGRKGPEAHEAQLETPIGQLAASHLLMCCGVSKTSTEQRAEARAVSDGDTAQATALKARYLERTAGYAAVRRLLEDQAPSAQVDEAWLELAVRNSDRGASRSRSGC